MACVRKSRDGWVLDYRDGEGKRVIQKVASRGEGEDKLAEIKKALRQGTYDPGLAKTRVRDYAVDWLESRRSDLKKSTFTSYEYSLRSHIVPDLGNIEIGKLTRQAVRFFLGRKAKQKKANGAELSRDTVRIIKMTLHGMLESAVQDGIIPSNVAHFKATASASQRRAKGEKQARIRAKVFTREQLFLMFQTARDYAPDYLPLLFLLARTGLRIGEAIALRIGDIDFVNRLVNVEKNIVKGEIGLPKNGLTRQVDMST